MATPDLAANFRARSWMWFRVCRGCGGLFDTGPMIDRLRAKAAERGLRVRPRKYCTGCVIKMIMSWSDDDDDA